MSDLFFFFYACWNITKYRNIGDNLKFNPEFYTGNYTLRDVCVIIFIRINKYVIYKSLLSFEILKFNSQVSTLHEVTDLLHMYETPFISVTEE